MKTRLLIVSIIVGLLFILSWFQHRIEGYKSREHAIEEFMLLPRGELLKPLTLSHEQLVADIIWLRAIQVVGEKTVTPQGYAWIYNALDVVTTLDPKFDYAYQFGGIILSVLGKVPEKSNALLLKGVRENPNVWQIPFYIGFNYFFYLNDYASAAKYMAQASILPGHPAYLPRLAARLYIQAGDPSTAVEFLDRMIRESQDEKIRKALEERRAEILQGKAEGVKRNKMSPGPLK